MVDTAVIVREPVGVVAGIAPWNAPFGIMLNKVAYALIARQHDRDEAVARKPRSKPTSSPRRPKRRACRRA